MRSAERAARPQPWGWSISTAGWPLRQAPGHLPSHGPHPLPRRDPPPGLWRDAAWRGVPLILSPSLGRLGCGSGGGQMRCRGTEAYSCLAAGSLSCPEVQRESFHLRPSTHLRSLGQLLSVQTFPRTQLVFSFSYITPACLGMPRVVQRFASDFIPHLSSGFD